LSLTNGPKPECFATAAPGDASAGAHSRGLKVERRHGRLWQRACLPSLLRSLYWSPCWLSCTLGRRCRIRSRCSWAPRCQTPCGAASSSRPACGVNARRRCAQPLRVSRAGQRGSRLAVQQHRRHEPELGDDHSPDCLASRAPDPVAGARRGRPGVAPVQVLAVCGGQVRDADPFGVEGGEVAFGVAQLSPPDGRVRSPARVIVERTELGRRPADRTTPSSRSNLCRPPTCGFLQLRAGLPSVDVHPDPMLSGAIVTQLVTRLVDRLHRSVALRWRHAR
jgi:hypothetical protein